MEKIFTATHADLARFKKSAPEEAVPDEERNMREAYHYTKVRLFFPHSTPFLSFPFGQ
jgi:hypothetical protein